MQEKRLKSMEWKPIFETALSNGIFCFLFCFLFWYVMKQNSEREKQLQNLISEYNHELKKISETLIKIQEKLDRPKRKKSKE